MIRLSRSQPQPIGLDIGLDSIKMLQLEVTDNSTLSVLAAARQTMPEEVRNQHSELRLPMAVDMVRQMLRTNDFAGKRVVTTLPREIVHVKNLRLPMMPADEIESAVQFEARNVFGFDTDEAVIQHFVAGEVRQGNDTRLEVIAVAVKQEQINAFLEQLHRCGCTLESLDLEQSALYRSVERFIRRRDDEHEVYVLVDVGARRTQVIIGKGREVSFIKPIEIGAQTLQVEVSRKLGITVEEARSLRRRLIEQQQGQMTPTVSTAIGAAGQPDSVGQAVYDAIRSKVEELAREISLCLRYYSVTFRGQRPEKARILGGEAGDPQLLSILASTLPIKIETGRPLFSVNTSKMKQSDRRGSMSEWAVALGLGLRLTCGNFGARDGKQRTAGPPVPEPVGAATERSEIPDETGTLVGVASGSASPTMLKGAANA